MSIFLSIAAYSDPVLPFTLARAVATARYPESLHFGIVDQSPAASPPPNPAAVLPARVSYVRIEPVYARGPCWARAIGMSLYDGEDWFFQLDSHMDFDAHWDERLVRQAEPLQAGRPGAVLSSYPNAFVFEGDLPVWKPSGTKILSHVVKPGTGFEDDHLVLSFEAHPVDEDTPLPGFHLGAGCLFGPGHLVQDFPYDPWYYFHGEEQAYAARLFTHGWDIFHVPDLPVYHLYNTPGSGAPKRPVHWDETEEKGRALAWWRLEERSRQRLTALLEGAPLGAYALGRVRSMADYADFSGIDFSAKSIGEQAYRASGRRLPA